MTSEFDIKGLFYEKEGYKFRKFLDIKTKNSYQLNPDLLVIMMNPGSSKPLDGIDNNCKISKAKPDRTQDQIMRIMLQFGYQYTRVLNLSDLREPKSKIFYSKMREMKDKKIAHSIFDEDRVVDFERLFVKNVPVIYAWGVSHKLKDVALKAMKKMNQVSPIGLKKQGTEFGYYHPLPPSYIKQKLWLKNITEFIVKYQKQ